MNITTEQRQAMRAAYEHKDFAEIVKFGDKILEIWERQNCLGEDEFQTLRLTFEKEFKVKGLIEFFHILYNIVYDKESNIQEKSNEHERLQPS